LPNYVLPKVTNDSLLRDRAVNDGIETFLQRFTAAVFHLAGHGYRGNLAQPGRYVMGT